MKNFLPPEWAPQSGVLLTWPHAESNWGDQLVAAENVLVAMTKQIALREKVLISCLNADHQQHVKTLLENAQVKLQQVKLAIAASDDIWARDHGPITVLADGKPTLLDFTFNAWGSKYNATRDNVITQTLQRQHLFGNTPLQTIDFILEGGSIEVDGQGSLMTTTHCLLSANRNTHLTQADFATYFQQYFGIEQILWLDHGYLAGDDTDSHIDTLARFVDSNTICYVECDETLDPHYPALLAMKKQLMTFRNTKGLPYQLVPLPWPKPKFSTQGQRLPATYANFLIINAAVLVPTYDDPADETALARIQACFPQREIIGIDCSPLITQYGSLHCATMQLLEGVLP